MQTVKPAATGTGTSVARLATHSPVIPRNGYTVHDTDIMHNGQKFAAGVWLHRSKRTEDGQETPTHEWICGPLHVLAITRSQSCSDGYGVLMRFTNRDGSEITWAMPLEWLAGRKEQILSVLYSRGLKIEYSKHSEIVGYITSQNPLRRVISTATTGWIENELFVTPLEAIGNGDAIFQSESAAEGEYGRAGTLGGWQQAIAAILPLNPLLQLGIGAALAGPLLAPLNIHSGGGFHLLWDSSNGKTTIVMCAASVWGHGVHFTLKWNATANGLEGIAALRNDSLLALDELGQADPNNVGDVVYSVADGIGKQRAGRSSAARQVRRWRVLLLSTGEVTLETKMKDAGKLIRAGQEVRLVTVSAGRRFGAWDDLHGYPSGEALSDALINACGTHYGHLGPEFVRRLIEHDDKPRLPGLLENIYQRFPSTSGQSARVAKRFAIVALALELATAYGLLPLAEGEGTNSMVELFDGWQAGRGEGPSEDRQILRATADFIDRHGASRFQAISAGAEVVRDRAGFWEQSGSARIYLLTRSGLEEATSGYELSRVLRTLDSVGAIVKKEPGKLQHRKRLPDGSNPGLYWIDPARLHPGE